jgi:hypothetical protein
MENTVPASVLRVPAREHPVAVPKGQVAIRILSGGGMVGRVADAAVRGDREHLLDSAPIVAP